MPFPVSPLLLYQEAVVKDVLWLKNTLWQHLYRPPAPFSSSDPIYFGETFRNSTKALPSLSPFSCTNRSVAHTLEVSFRRENRLDFSCCLNAFWWQRNPAHCFHLFPLKKTFQHIKHISVSHWKNWNTCKWWKKDEPNPETYDWKHYIEYTLKRAMLHNEFMRCYLKWAIVWCYYLLVLLIHSTFMPVSILVCFSCLLSS